MARGRKFDGNVAGRMAWYVGVGDVCCRPAFHAAHPLRTSFFWWIMYHMISPSSPSLSTLLLLLLSLLAACYYYCYCCYCYSDDYGDC